MDIKTASFVTSMPRYGAFERKGLPQIAVAGRSNVGKSSLINALCRVRGLAKTSSTPGKTRLINVFLINENLTDPFHLIDLPGYGFARVSQKERDSWGKMMDGYFQKAEELRLILHLVDIRHAPSGGDLMMNQFLYQSGLPFTVVATKADKLSRAQRGAALPVIARDLAVQPFDIIPVSAQTGEGRDKLLARIGAALQ